VIVNQALQYVVQNVVGRQGVLINLTGFEFSARRLSEDVGRKDFAFAICGTCLTIKPAAESIRGFWERQQSLLIPIHIAVEW